MKILRPADVGGLPLETLYNLALLDSKIEPTETGVVINGRGNEPHKLSVRPLLTSANSHRFAEIWAGVETADRRQPLDIAQIATQRQRARERLDAGKFGDFVWPIASVDSRRRFEILNDVLVPTFFEKHPDGQIHLVEYSPRFNSSLAVLSVLGRAAHLRTDDHQIHVAHMGKSWMAAFGFNVPAEMLYAALTLGLSWSFPRLPGFVATCKHERFLVFLLGRPHVMTEPDASDFERMLPNMLNIMGERVEQGPLAPEDYVPPPLTRPLDRRRFSMSEMTDYLSRYVDALGETFAWLDDLDNYGKVAEPDVLDVDFAQATWLSFFVLLATQFSIINQRVHFARKFAFFDSLELFTALATSNGSLQPETWGRFAGDAYARDTLASQLARYGAVGDELAASVHAIRDRASEVVERGLLYAPDEHGNIRVADATMTLDEFEPKLYRALRNSRHGFAIRDSAILNVHSGDLSNDLPDLSLAMFLGLLADKTPFGLRRT